MRNEHRFGLGSKLLLSKALSMLNKNLTGFVQSLFSVQSICTVRKGSASRVAKLLPRDPRVVRPSSFECLRACILCTNFDDGFNSGHRVLAVESIVKISYNLQPEVNTYVDVNEAKLSKLTHIKCILHCLSQEVEFSVSNVQVHGGYVLHVGAIEGTLRVGDMLKCQIDEVSAI